MGNLETDGSSLLEAKGFRVTDEKAPQNGSPTTGDANPFAGVRVLYAEDHPEMQRAVERLLRVAGASVAIACDGREAVDRALAEPFDLILMDLRMPRMNGLEAARVLRARGSRVPLVAVTADATPGVRANAVAAGFDVVLPKPFELSDLIAALHFGRARRRGQRGNAGSV